MRWCYFTTPLQYTNPLYFDSYNSVHSSHIIEHYCILHPSSSSFPLFQYIYLTGYKTRQYECKYSQPHFLCQNGICLIRILNHILLLVTDILWISTSNKLPVQTMLPFYYLTNVLDFITIWEYDISRQEIFILNNILPQFFYSLFCQDRFDHDQ